MVYHIVKQRYDVVLIHGLQTCSAWLVFFAAKFVGTKVIFRGEGLLKKTPQKLWKRVAKWLIRKLLVSSDAAMFSCNGNKQYWRDLGFSDQDLFFIPCAVDNQFFRDGRIEDTERRSSLRAELGIHDDDFVILFSARFTTRKRPLDLIQAVSKLESDRVVILFIGDGVLREGMESEAERLGVRTVFCGFINQSRLSTFYSLADSFAVISEYDASPKALNEVLNFGVPVICSRGVGTAGELAVEGVNGFVVDVGDVDAVARALKKLVDNPGLCEEMGRASINIVENWNIEADARAIYRASQYVVSKC